MEEALPQKSTSEVYPGCCGGQVFPLVSAPAREASGLGLIRAFHGVDVAEPHCQSWLCRCVYKYILRTRWCTMLLVYSLQHGVQGPLAGSDRIGISGGSSYSPALG